MFGELFHKSKEEKAVLKRISYILLFLLTAFGLNAAAQETEAISSSALTGIALPKGAMLVRKNSVPQEIKDILSKGFEGTEGKLKQGETEVILWSEANLKPADYQRIMSEVETNLKKSRWIYAVEAVEDGVTGFSLLQTEPRRGMFGFFIPSDKILLFAVTEMLPVAGGNAAVPEIRESLPENAGDDQGSGSGAAKLSNLTGKWQSPKLTNTSYKNYGSKLAGDSLQYTYEIFPDGTVEKIERAVSTYGACWTENIVISRGGGSSGNGNLTVDFGAAKQKFNASCEKALPAQTETKAVRLNVKNGQTQLCVGSGRSEVCMNRLN